MAEIYPKLSSPKIGGWLLVYVVLLSIYTLGATVNIFLNNIIGSALKGYFPIWDFLIQGILFPLFLWICLYFTIKKKSKAQLLNKIALSTALIFIIVLLIQKINFYSLGGNMEIPFTEKLIYFIDVVFLSNWDFLIIAPVPVIIFLIYFFKSKRVKNTLIR